MTRPKRLFILRKYRKGPALEGLYFHDKMEAKRHRDMLGGDTVVSYGPDHRLFRSQMTEKTNASEYSD